jgi:hypothetical protein
MPNYCNNDLTLTHTDPAMIAKAATALKEGDFLQTFVPVPAELLEATASFGDEYEAQNKANVEKYGYASWYDFCVNEWGTKWDVQAYDEANVFNDGLTLTVGFDSAWSPPVEAYRKLEELGFEVDAMYYEPGMGFCGEYVNGSDETYDIPGTSDEVSECIPDRINDAFCIAENMADWESQQEEFED